MSFDSIAGNVMRVKAFLPFLQGVPARYTKLHRAYLGWLVRITQFNLCIKYNITTIQNTHHLCLITRAVNVNALIYEIMVGQINPIKYFNAVNATLFTSGVR